MDLEGLTRQDSQPPLASVHPCKIGILMPTLLTFWSYCQHHNKFFILWSLFFIRYTCPIRLLNSQGQGLWFRGFYYYY